MTTSELIKELQKIESDHGYELPIKIWDGVKNHAVTGVWYDSARLDVFLEMTNNVIIE